MNEFVDILADQFGVDKPIMIEEIRGSFPDVSEVTIYKWLDRAMSDSTIRKFKRGVYYLPKESALGLGELPLSAEAVIRKKYLSKGDVVYGYLSGLNLENAAGVSPQVPATLEITTNKTSKRVREIEPFGGWRKITLRKPRIEITKDNVDALRFLDLVTRAPFEFFDDLERWSMSQFAKSVDKSKVIECLRYYPAKTAKNLMESGYLDVLA
jgi:hypothetical protein